MDRSDGSPVTLHGDYAIISALRGHPSTVIEVRRHDSDGSRDLEVRFFTGVSPDAVLQELHAPDGRLGYILYAVDQAVVNVADICGVKPDLDHLDAGTVPPQRTVITGAGAGPSWSRRTEVRVATPSGTDVAVTSLVVGVGPDGLWVIDPAEDPDAAVWGAPLDVGQRITVFVTPPPGSPSWLPGTNEASR